MTPSAGRIVWGTSLRFCGRRPDRPVTSTTQSVASRAAAAQRRTSVPTTRPMMAPLAVNAAATSRPPRRRPRTNQRDERGQTDDSAELTVQSEPDSETRPAWPARTMRPCRRTPTPGRRAGRPPQLARAVQWAPSISGERAQPGTRSIRSHLAPHKKAGRAETRLRPPPSGLPLFRRAPPTVAVGRRSHHADWESRRTIRRLIRRCSRTACCRIPSLLPVSGSQFSETGSRARPAPTGSAPRTRRRRAARWPPPGTAGPSGTR